LVLYPLSGKQSEEGSAPPLNKGDLVVGLDIGTSSIQAIIGELDGTGLNIIGVGTARSEGMKKGAIVDIDKTVASIRAATEHAERMVGITIDSAFVGLSGNHIELIPAHGVVAVSTTDREIGDEDVRRVLDAAKMISTPPERQIVDVVPREFTVDGLTGVTDPRGMIGVRLEVDAYVATGSRTVMHNLLRCVERAGIEVIGTVIMPLAAGEMLLSADERRLGVALVDLGAGQATVTIFDKGVMHRIGAISLGADTVTHDIAIGLQTGFESAEALKCRYGYALMEMVPQEEKFKLQRIGNAGDEELSKTDLAEIIEARMQELFSLIKQEIAKLGYANGVPGGYVLYGGGTLLKGTERLAGYVLGTPVRVASPDFVGVRDPSYVGCVGMIQHVARHWKRSPVAATKEVRRGRQSQTALARLKAFLQDFI
jgi:cell division protein FtsA